MSNKKLQRQQAEKRIWRQIREQHRNSTLNPFTGWKEVCSATQSMQCVLSWRVGERSIYVRWYTVHNPRHKMVDIKCIRRALDSDIEQCNISSHVYNGMYYMFHDCTVLNLCEQPWKAWFQKNGHISKKVGRRSFSCTLSTSKGDKPCLNTMVNILKC